MEISRLLNAPCLFCGYNGSGYYQEHTHDKDCPFRYTVGIDDRVNQFPLIVKKLYRNSQKNVEPQNNTQHTHEAIELVVESLGLLNNLESSMWEETVHEVSSKLNDFITAQQHHA